MGRGLAYGKKIGDLLLAENIEKVYELSGDGQSRVTDLLSGIPDEVLEIADAIATFAKETITGKVNDSLFLTLADHINGVVIRLKDNIVVKNFLLWDIKRFFPEEYAIGQKAIEQISRKYDIKLDEDEAGFIAMHIVNSELGSRNSSAASQLTKLIEEIVTIVKYSLQVSLNEEDIYYQRFMTHLTMPEADVREIIQFFKANEIEYYLESNSGLFGSDNYSEKITETIAEYTNRNLAETISLREKFSWFDQLIASFANQPIDYADVNKISFINNRFAYQSIAEKFGHQFEMFNMTVPFFGKESGEIAVKGNDKETAITIVLNKLGMTKEDAISFGDANNDLAMFRACGYNIAMGNGTEELKVAAAEVTSDVDHDGIAVSLEANQYFKM